MKRVLPRDVIIRNLHLTGQALPLHIDLEFKCLIDLLECAYQAHALIRGCLPRHFGKLDQSIQADILTVMILYHLRSTTKDQDRFGGGMDQMGEMESRLSQGAPVLDMQLR